MAAFGTVAHVEIPGKGRKQRVIALCKSVGAVLAVWLEETNPAPDGCGLVDKGALSDEEQRLLDVLVARCGNGVLNV